MAYTKEYWEKNGGTISERRKLRYETDPVYREQVKERSRAYRQQQRDQKKKQMVNPTIVIAGQPLPATSLAQVCADLGITENRMKYLQKTGYIPAALVTRPVRLYTKNQSALIAKLEKYLAKNSEYLRSVRTKRGLSARSGLAALTDTIKENWET